MSNYLIRTLADAIATRISDHPAHSPAELAKEIEAVFHERYAGETVQLYVPKLPAAIRRDRRAAIVAQYNGHNVKELAHRFGISQSAVFKILAARSL